MTEDISEDDCWREALALLLRWQAEPDNDVIKQEIKDFCALSTSHLDAWLEAKKVYRIGGMAVDAGKQPGHPSSRTSSISRRQILLSLGILTVAGGALAYRSGSTLPAGTTQTRVAEVREITLEDGTRVTVGPDTTFSVSMREDSRVLELQDGLVYCSPASDWRPFVLKTARMSVSCSNATVEVMADDGSCCVTVAEGSAQVRFEPAMNGDDEIGSGEWLRVGDISGIERGNSDPQQAGQWRNGTLVVENESVGTVIRRIARWQRSKIFIPQERLAASRVSGLYDLSDPLVAMQAVIGPHGGHVRKLAPWTVVLTTL
ncbi:hypothetical protein GAO09_13150 [Rhizobiales bacterium RZME27]|jgi:transmembrane sensor|uniref:FecR protein domain-containing protein n=1 Tax=Endobacterium cereale TaxID=2663029 RepID=A0A6A8AAL0_9HYPH|nr:FecR domain-containing protein [Endobacterium cereale]MEB2844388.1 FecR domain-containing protein [Endobacterium cereale]MQY46978.1 hypothetical protein [Endobacterium cereale]